MDIKTLDNLLKLALMVIGIFAIISGTVKAMQLLKKGRGMLRSILPAVGGIALGIGCFVGTLFLHSDVNERGQIVMGNYPSSIENITYGQAFHAACENIQWSQIARDHVDSSIDTVQMDADCTYNGEKHRIKIQFDFSMIGLDNIAKKEVGPFKIYFAGLDGAQESTTSDMQDIIYDMFQTYAEKHQIELDESMKAGILYTKGWRHDRDIQNSAEEENDEQEQIIDEEDITVTDLTNTILGSENAWDFMAEMEVLSGYGFSEPDEDGIRTMLEWETAAVLDLSDGGSCYSVMIRTGEEPAYSIHNIWCGMDYEQAVGYLNEICSESGSNLVDEGTDDFKIGNNLLSIINEDGTVSGIVFIKDVLYMEENENTYEDFSVEEWEEPDGYVFAESDRRLLEDAELAVCSPEMLRIAKNEIYARHGRRFKDEALQEYFDSMSWYMGAIEPEDFDESVLNEFEKENLKKIVEYENRN